MNKPIVKIIDYGVGNLYSVYRAFEYCEANIQIAKKPSDLKNSNKIIVPGVGSFNNCMSQIKLLGFDDAILNANQKKISILGICVGMQILFDDSEEFGLHQGLGLFSGHVKPISQINNTKKIRIPHIGWNSLTKASNKRSWDINFMRNIEDKKNWFYFVHSYSAEPNDESIRLADCIYGDKKICSIIHKDNIYATQFHLERSGQEGLNLIRNYLNS